MAKTYTTESYLQITEALIDIAQRKPTHSHRTALRHAILNVSNNHEELLAIRAFFTQLPDLQNWAEIKDSGITRHFITTLIFDIDTVLAAPEQLDLLTYITFWC